MAKTGYNAFEALDPFFAIVMKGVVLLTANTISIHSPMMRSLSRDTSSPAGL